MKQPYRLEDLEHWDASIREHVVALGLDCFSQEFELCDHGQMLGYMAYSGMPAHYPHWSYGKAYEKLKTLYDHGVSGLPYEMVINANPALGYLMRDNSLCLQILTIAHVYGHNDFFKNNRTFATTRPEYTLATFKAHADRVRRYLDTPGIACERVESLLDAAHALSLQTRRNLAVQKRTPAEQRDRAIEAATPPHDPFRRIHARPASDEPDLHRVPLEPDEDLLLFIRDHNTFLADWERDLLGIVHAQSQYFIPQIETKIMNEGWATFAHKRIMERLDLPSDLHLEYLVRHSQVVQPSPGGLNPYHLGLRVWEEIARIATEPTAEDREHFPDRAGDASLLLETRTCDRDTSFLRRWLTPRVMQDLGLFRYEPKGDELVVSHVADADGWRAVKETLLQAVGMGSVPVIRVVDADWGGSRTLRLAHEHDGRDLQLDHAEHTMAHVFRLWGRTVRLDTVVDGRATTLSYGDAGFALAHAS